METASLPNLISDLKRDEAKFFNFFRMSVALFYAFLNKIRLKITKTNSQLRQSIPAEERLALTLR